MGKKEEKQLLEAAIKGDKEKVEKLLYPKHKSGQPIPQLERADVKDFRMKVSVTHINVDCRNDSGSTPLILAVLNGHKAVAALFIMHSCSMNVQDALGNTAMHWAAFHNQLEMVDMLVKAAAPCDISNLAGEYPLHFAVRNFQAGKPFVVVRLLQGGAGASVKNKDGDTPLVLASRLDKREAVSLLVDADKKLINDCKPMIEAAKTGHLEVMRILLDACFDPNGMDNNSGTRPLHEAIRFFRTKIAELLVSFGADCKLKNTTGETAESIARQHPGGKGQEYLTIFEEYKSKPLVKPKAVLERERQAQAESAKTQRDREMVLRPLVTWSSNSTEYCSSNVKTRPIMHLLDNDPSTMYSMKGAMNNWVILDFGCTFELKGIRLFGWDSNQMVKNFQLFVGDSLSGPWTLVKALRAKRLGSTRESDEGVLQEFKDFYAVNRFAKIIFADNHGSEDFTSLHGIEFIGVDTTFEPCLTELGLAQYHKAFVQNSITQLIEMAALGDEELKTIVPLPGHFKKLSRAVKKMSDRFQLRSMWWVSEPPPVAVAGEVMPDIKVKVDPIEGMSFILTALGNCPLQGGTAQKSVRHGARPATITFSGISISEPGTFLFEVHPLSREEKSGDKVFLQALQPISVRVGSRTDEEIEAEFKDIMRLVQVSSL